MHERVFKRDRHTGISNFTGCHRSCRNIFFSVIRRISRGLSRAYHATCRDWHTWCDAEEYPQRISSNTWYNVVMIGMSSKIDRLIAAMVEHEGWAPPPAGPNQTGSRSYRHHNPGNLRASPFASAVVEGFAVFRSDDVGYMAMHWDILQKSRGNTSTGLNGNSTIRELLYKWAPPSDGNDAEAYVQSVVAKSGLPESTTLSELFQN